MRVSVSTSARAKIRRLKTRQTITLNCCAQSQHAQLARIANARLIEPLLKAIAAARDALSPRVPVLVKIAPDLSFDEIDGIVDAARDVNFDGIIATNTTISRDGVPAYIKNFGGGMSGEPLRARSTQIIHHICETTRGEFP